MGRAPRKRARVKTANIDWTERMMTARLFATRAKTR
jgi:hypothetical protein